MNDIYGIEPQLIDKGFSLHEAKKETEDITNRFWNQHFLKYNNENIRPGVADLIQKMHRYGYEIHLLSLRGKESKKVSRPKKHIRVRVIRCITKSMLRRNKIYYDKLVLVENIEDKLEYIKFYYPNIIFEDQTSILEKIDKSIRKVCILSSHNVDKKLSEVTYIKDYNRDASIIELLLDKRYIRKNKKDIKDAVIDVFQYMIKSIGKWYFLAKFKPIVYGRENIPRGSGVIFIGNHRNNLDPILISILGKSSIRWAALLRLFQGKEDLFNADSGWLRRKLFARFITTMGALPIARPEDENYREINLKTIAYLMKILMGKGKVGFFPEGTINRYPEKNNILPLQSDRVFRMAIKTDSFVQPFSIVWAPQEITAKNRVVIMFSKPINTYNRSKKEVIDIWSESVNKNIRNSV